jgi:hypothetical protein
MAFDPQPDETEATVRLGPDEADGVTTGWRDEQATTPIQTATTKMIVMTGPRKQGRERIERGSARRLAYACARFRPTCNLSENQPS